jgi:hypothetical protein
MNEGELHNLMFQTGRMDESSFLGLIIKAGYKADSSNMAKLKEAFPELMESIQRWKTEEGYANKLLRTKPHTIDGKRVE